MQLFIFLIFLSFSAFAEHYYQWIDENGIMHFSDTAPAKNKQTKSKKHLPITSTVELFSISKPNFAASENKTIENKTIAYKITILKPLHQETIRNNQGIIHIVVNTNHPLNENQHIQLLLNNKKLEKQKSFDLKLENLHRGSYKLKALIIENKKILTSSKEIIFFLHRARIKREH